MLCPRISKRERISPMLKGWTGRQTVGTERRMVDAGGREWGAVCWGQKFTWEKLRKFKRWS